MQNMFYNYYFYLYRRVNCVLYELPRLIIEMNEINYRGHLNPGYCNIVYISHSRSI